MLSTRVKAFQAAGSRPQVRGASVIVAARPTKAADFKGLDNAELLQKVSELKREHLRLEYMQRTRGNVINPGAVSRFSHVHYFVLDSIFDSAVAPMYSQHGRHGTKFVA
jgi:ribosomal protein L29